MRADMSAYQKVTASHLQREAYLYVRQSTLRQVFENTESTKRQYALRERAVALGWPGERVVVIDSDLGQSGAASDREGFQKLVAAVGMGQLGVELGLEVSRLARSSTDWHRLLEISALLHLDAAAGTEPSACVSWCSQQSVDWRVPARTPPLPNGAEVGVKVLAAAGTSNVSVLDKLDFQEVQRIVEGLARSSVTPCSR
jgi:hypothetical protein